MAKRRYQLGEFVLDPERRLLTRAGEPVHLTQKPFRVLLYLVENRDRVVRRSELLDRFWEGKDVYDDTLRKTVGAIRKALEDRGEQPQYIETVYGEGFRYVGRVEEQTAAEAAPANGGFPAAAGRTPLGGQNAEDDGQKAGAPAPATYSEVASPAHMRGVILAVVAAAVALVALGALLARSVRGPEPGPGPAIPSVAVLPFRNLSGDPANEYLSDGLTDHLTNTLAKIEGLRVSARGSAYTFKGQDVDPQEAGKRLGVAALLQGAVYRRERGVRVEARLVSTADGRVLWAGDTADRRLDEIILLQDEIARRVLAGLKFDLSADGERRLARHHTENVEAYEAYLRGRYQWYLRTPEGLSRSVEHFQEAIRLDPNYALAYAGLADSYSTSVWFGKLETHKVAEKAAAAARRALELDEGLAEAHVAMSRAHGLDLAGAEAAREIERALEIAPDNADAHHFYAYTLLALGQADRAVAEIKLAREFDPLSVVMNVDVGEVLLYARRYGEAEAALRHAIEMDPNRANAHWDLAIALQLQGEEAEAFEEYMRTKALEGKPPEEIRSYREAYARAGLSGVWRRALEVEKARPEYVPPFKLAMYCAQAGEPDRAFAHLEQLYRERSPHLSDLRLNPLFDTLRADPRFDALAARAGL